MATTDFDYSTSNMVIQYAMLDDAKKHPGKKTLPLSIRWGEYRIQTSDVLSVPKEGIVRLEFLSWSETIRQGADI